MSGNFVPRNTRPGSPRNTKRPTSILDLLNPFSEREYNVRGDNFYSEGNNLFTRGGSGLLQLPDTIIRGITNLGKGAYKDTEKLLFEGVGALGGDTAYGNKVRDREYQSSEMVTEVAKSFPNTVDTIGDLTYLPNLLMGRGVDEANKQAMERVTQFDEDPAMFLLEHVGNASIAGMAIAGPARLGAAMARGSMTGATAARGLRPLAGRGVRTTARQQSAQAAETARAAGQKFSAPQMTEFLGDVVGHPYQSAFRKARTSYPAELIRNPIARTEAMERLGGLWKQDEGSLNFKAGDPRSRYNELAKEYAEVQRALQYSSEPYTKAAMERTRLELENSKNELISRGIEVPEGDAPFSLSGADPADLVATSDFEWGRGTADEFASGLIESAELGLRHQNTKVEPNTIGVLGSSGGPVDYSSVYQTNGEGRVVGVLKVFDDDVHLGVSPESRGQGISKKLVQRAIMEGLPVEQAMSSGNVEMSQFGAGFTESVRKGRVSGESPLPERMIPSDVEVNPVTNRLAEVDQLAREVDMAEYHVEELRAHGASSAEITNSEGLFNDLEIQYEKALDADPVTGTGLGGDNTGQLSSTTPGERSGLMESLGELLSSEEGSLNIFGPRNKVSAGGNRFGPLDMGANEVGLLLDKITSSSEFEAVFGKDVRSARRLMHDLRESLVTGRGEIGQETQGMVGNEVGTQNLRRQWDPSRVERLFLRDLDNLGKRGDGKYTDLVEYLESERPSASSLPLRGAQVATGGRVVGQTLNPTQLVDRVTRVLDEAKREAGGDPTIMGNVLEEMLPGVDPMGMYLIGLNAIEKAKNLPANSLTSALGDFITMDRFGDINRRAQQSLGDKAAGVTGERFTLPSDELGVDLSTFTPKEQSLFYDAATEYRRQGLQREQTLVTEGQIPEGGTRLGRSPEETTIYGTTLDDLPLDRATSARIELTRLAKENQSDTVQGLLDEIGELEGSGRPTMSRDPEARITYRNGRPTQASMDRAFKRTQTGKAIDRRKTKLGQERETLVQVSSRLDALEEMAVRDPGNSPASARDLLNYSNNVAPAQAKALREMAAEGVGDPKVMDALAKELEAIPQTLEDLNSAEVYLAYLKDVKDRGNTGNYGPGTARALDTRPPTRRRGTATDIQFTRDFRTRAYWQDAEFQAHFMMRQADEMVHRQGLVKTGKSRLRDAGWSDEDIAGASRNQIQQGLEKLRLRSYSPDKLFPSGRKPTPPNMNPLDAEWIAPWIENTLFKALEGPGNFERIVMQGVYDPAINGWKTFVLALRAAWQVNNVSTNSMLTMLVGKVSPLDYPSLMRASTRAVHKWNQGIPSEIRVPLTGKYRSELVAKLNTLDEASSQAISIKRMLDDGAISMSNEVLTDISSKGLTRGDSAWLNNSQFLRDQGATSSKNIFQQFGVELPQIPGRLGERVRNLRQTAREGVDIAYHINETADNMHRTAVYLDQIGKGNTHQQGLTQVAKTLGDYSKLTAFERRWVKRAYPFWPWMRHVIEVVGRSVAPGNITRTVIFAHLTNILGQPNEFEEMLPDYGAGNIYMGDAEDGTPKFLSVRGLNPFLDVFDPASQPNLQGFIRPTSPPIQWLYEKWSGTSTLTGRQITSPTGDPDARPPLSEYFVRSIPQLKAGRDVYRDLMGQPLTRYGTGEPAFFPGAEDNRSGAQSVAQLMGINIRPLNVEDMHNREIIEEYRRESAQLRQDALEESQGGRTASDLLPDFLTRQ